MSQALPVPYDCVRCPTECSPTQVPGVQGEPGANGTNGTDGINAFTIVTSDFVMPAIGGTVVVEVESTAWMVGEQGAVYGQALAIEFAGTLLITAIVDPTHVTIINLGYTGNAAPGSAIPAGARVGASGVEGPAGSISGAAGGDLQGTYPDPLLKDIGSPGTTGDSTHVARITTDNAGRVTAASAVAIAFPAQGTAAALNKGVLDTQLAPNDGNLTAGESLWATATGQETKSAADARLALGIGGQAGNYVLVQERIASGGSESAFNTGADIPVPITDLVINEGAIASIDVPNKRITLPVGRYRVRASVPGAKCDSFQVWLYNFTNNVVELVGSSARSDATDATTSYSLINGVLIVAGMSKVYGLIARSTATGTFGVGVSFGQTFVTTSWELEQES